MSKTAAREIVYELHANKNAFRLAIANGKEVALDEDGTTTYATSDPREQAALDAADGVKRQTKASDDKETK